MKFPGLLLVAALFSSSGCDQARQLAARISPVAKTAGKTASPALISTIRDTEYDLFARQRGKVAVIQFTAVWSGKSRQLEAFFREAVPEYGGRVVVGMVDFESSKTLATALGVKEVPDLRIYRDGRFMEKIVGLADEKELRGKLAAYSTGLVPPAATGGEGLAGKPLASPMQKDWMPAGMKRR